jgi:hypothetical protein
VATKEACTGMGFGLALTFAARAEMVLGNAAEGAEEATGTAAAASQYLSQPASSADRPP